MKYKKLKILSFGDPVLRQAASPVTVFHSKLHSLIDSISYTLYNQDDGAALAANQVGILKRITVIDYEDEFIEMINPEILEMEGNQIGYEGCLSYPGYQGIVSRFNLIKVKYLNRFGEEFTIERKDKLSRCIQHEIDHLNGILFIDRMEEKFLVHTENKKKISLKDVLEITEIKQVTLNTR